MFRFAILGDGAVRNRLAQLSQAACSYPEVGALRNLAFPPGYRVDQHRVLLGRGAACFERAKLALRRWEMFNVSWVRLHPPAPPIEANTDIAISTRYLGLWYVNFCRIAYALEDQGEIERFGFALGTLPGHVLAGEERFCIEWHRADASVWYSVAAFSRPCQILSLLGYPILRHLQKRFASDSQIAIARACVI